MITIGVCGASGVQGKSVINELNKYENYKLIYITRNIDIVDLSNYKNSNLIEVRYGDYDRPLTMIDALVDCDYVYAVTNFWEHKNVNREMEQAKNIAIACKSNNVKGVVWSTLENSNEWNIELEKINNNGNNNGDNNNIDNFDINNNYLIPHFDSKGIVNQYFKDINIDTCFLHLSFYYSNFINLFPFEKVSNVNEENSFKYTIKLPYNNCKLPMLDTNDIGVCVKNIFDNFDNFKNKDIGLASDILTMNEIAKKISNVSNKQYEYNNISYKDYYNEFSQELANMFEFQKQINKHFCNLRDTKFWTKNNVKLTSFSEWLENNKEHF